MYSRQKNVETLLSPLFLGRTGLSCCVEGFVRFWLSADAQLQQSCWRSALAAGRAVTVRFSLSLLDVRFSGIVAARDYFGPGATVYCQVWTLYLALLSG